MRIRILPSALGDLRSGWQFYERQEEGLGDYFRHCLFSDIDSLVLYAGIHPRVHGLHRLLSKRFPFALYYEMPEEGLVVIWRVLDMRADPKGLEDELG